ncbi:hypothetical protein TSOC_003665 [Tetrabaena socialis]|uniref:Uncharacterized protein n=1 Tax=Tetrabaena socialis TaxID=47790 RepID=A0A2J8AAW1_9CHLO|nr:hypothetical protein TSOC_003665 [Tetrabaena socialis]|eukprot:PNH09660.1 hypothetical protein TSOC_003665 [Tetrabaena socialis]
MDARLTWRQLLSIVRYGNRPTEMLAKRLAIIGAITLVVAHSLKDQARMRSYAGVLLAEDRAPRRPTRSKSAALLGARLLLTCLLLFAGWSQLRRITARGGSLWQAAALTPRQQADANAAAAAADAALATAATAASAAALGAVGGGADAADATGVGALAGVAAGAGVATAKVVGGGGGDGWGAGPRQHYGVPDSHDNNWQLLEMLLCIPLALGWQTALTCRGLVALLLLEAVTCWPFWAWYWPSWHFAMHVRLHFFGNVAVAGGLVLLQCLGAGEYTIDSLMGRKTE